MRMKKVINNFLAGSINLNGSRAPSCFPWWQKDKLLEGIYLKDENSSEAADTNQTFSEHLELELDHTLVHWLVNPIFVKQDEVLVTRIYQDHVATGVERDCNELTAQEITQHWHLVEEAIRKE